MRGMRISLGVVGHFSLAVTDPSTSAAWWTSRFDLEEIFRFDDGVGLSNDSITIVLFAGTPTPQGLEQYVVSCRRYADAACGASHAKR